MIDLWIIVHSAYVWILDETGNFYVEISAMDWVGFFFYFDDFPL